MRHLALSFPEESAGPEGPGSSKAPTASFPFQHHLGTKPNQHQHKRREQPSPTKDTHHRRSKAPKLDSNPGNSRDHWLIPHAATSPTVSASTPESSRDNDSGNDSDDSLFGSHHSESTSDDEPLANKSAHRVPLAGLSPAVRNRAPKSSSISKERFRNAIENNHEAEKARRRRKFVPHPREITVDKLRLTNWNNELARFHYLMENDKFNGEAHAAELLQCLETVDRHKADRYITTAVLAETKIAMQVKVFRHAPYGRTVKEVANRICKAWRALCQEGAPAK